MSSAVAERMVEARLASATPSDDPAWMPAWKLAELIARRDLSPVDQLDRCLARINALDPHIRAFRSIDRDGARAAATRAEAAVLAGDALGPLHGVPVAVKEHIPVAGLTWHNLATGKKQPAPRDSVEAERLRAAGAILLGSTIAGGPELGQTDNPRNPWDLARVPGISSPGSATAVAAALVPLAIAADGLGSTRLPAALTGQVGLHPTRGRVPSFAFDVMNVRPITTTGPIARDVRDAALVLQILAGPDGREFFCLQDDAPDYLAGLDEGVAGMRLSWSDDLGYAGAYATPDSAAIVAMAREAAFRATGLGATIEEDRAVFTDPGWAGLLVLATDPVLNRTSLVPESELLRCRDIRREIWQQFRDALDGPEFLLSPTIPFTAPTAEAWTANWSDLSYMSAYTPYTAPANLIGWPAMTIPCGLLDGLPVGLQIMGRPNSEARMLQLAQALLH
jgi:aspartyl-tRNA(Asn)/glutamyl-tRNA(Gln) amidotransferase subunit A